MSIDPNVMAILNLIGLLIIALINAYTARVAVSTKTTAEKTEVNTNHMREQLVIATGAASHAAGKKEGLAEGAAKAAILAERDGTPRRTRTFNLGSRISLLCPVELWAR